MSVPPIPTPLDQAGSFPFHPQRPFSFDPPIVNGGDNQWLFQRATWNEIQVINTKSSAELWIPRRFVGGVSNADDPVMIVGLVKELELNAGAVYPHVRRVIEMPRRAQEKASTQGAASPAPVVGIRVESGSGARIILGTVATGLLACVALLIVFRDGTLGSRSTIGSRAAFGSRDAILAGDLPFTSQDDYQSIVSRLGPPAEDQWRSAGGVRYRRLWYPRQSFAMILVDDHYAGARDVNGRVIHSVQPLKNFR